MTMSCIPAPGEMGSRAFHTSGGAGSRKCRSNSSVRRYAIQQTGNLVGAEDGMNLNLDGKVALVTGASKGIGLACARQLAEEGCHLHIASRTKADLEQARETIRTRHNVSVTIHPVDLSNGDAARSLAAACPDIDILVNNAGAIPAGDLQAIDEANLGA